ncbi:hypothetical protein NMY22_g1229 [Coprinellus aureogranulatus]|nr:hypothetical protein NMY22_g1229 [Coprinellus aureogranulatus]
MTYRNSTHLTPRTICHPHRKLKRMLNALSGFRLACQSSITSTCLLLPVTRTDSNLTQVHLHHPQRPVDVDDIFFPFTGVEDTLLAEFTYKKVQMSAGHVNYLMTLWGALQQKKCGCQGGGDPPFGAAKHLYNTIDSFPYGDIPWQGFKDKYNGELPEAPAKWQTADIDWSPKEVKDRDGRCQYCDLMSGEWLWEQANELAKDPDLHGAMFAPVVLGSDKTIVCTAKASDLDESFKTDAAPRSHEHTNAVSAACGGNVTRCGFKQWTGNDSKALMKVFIPAMKGLVPGGMAYKFYYVNKYIDYHAFSIAS